MLSIVWTTSDSPKIGMIISNRIFLLVRPSWKSIVTLTYLLNDLGGLDTINHEERALIAIVTWKEKGWKEATLVEEKTLVNSVDLALHCCFRNIIYETDCELIDESIR